MPRRARIVLPGIAHHVTQRGNYRQKIFQKKSDYKQYSEWVNNYAQKNGLKILAYCLMSNHVHFICIPEKENSLARTFNTVHMRYAQYVHRGKKVKGHLWQGRFYSCVLDEGHLYRGIRYVERNPVRAKMVKKAWEYEWSSARDHAGEEGISRIPLEKNSFYQDGQQWREYLSDEDDEMVKEMRLKTQRGLVIGAQGFIEDLE